MNMRDCEIAAALNALAIRPPHTREWCVAYSGGVDSTVLLHAASRAARTHGIELRAVHVNHGVQDAAAEFEQHCAAVCAQWGIALERRVCTVAREKGSSLEAQAREARYQVLRDYATAGALVLLAHHQDDQAETLLLQMLRGAGPAGAGAMPSVRDWGEAQLARPLLHLPREVLEAYATRYELAFVEDPSNQELRYNRNFLRHEVAPVLRKRWPAFAANLSRAARHQAHAARLLRERAQEDLAYSDGMSVRVLEDLSEDRVFNLLRFWIAQHGHEVPSERRLHHWWRVVRTAGADRVPSESFGTCTLHRWRGRLYVSAIAPLVEVDQVWHWRRGETLELPELGRRLCWDELRTQMVHVPAGDVEVRLRLGGERCRVAGAAHHRPLKKLLQEAGVPPWQRGRIPLIYRHDQLRLVWDHFECESRAA